MIYSQSNKYEIKELIAASQSTGAAILIDKPLNWTSFNAVAKVRNLLKPKKIGHAGTLDPLATGLLILCTGKFTKIIYEFQDLYKVYTGTVKLGAITKSYDSEFEEENITNIDDLQESDIIFQAKQFLGKQLQMPPMFSAKKVNGKRLYELARKDIEVIRTPNEVEFFEIDVEYIKPFVNFRICCSKGTYIRTFANDLGASLRVGGYLTSLRRNYIGGYNVDDAITIDEFIELVKEYKDSNQ